MGQTPVRKKKSDGAREAGGRSVDNAGLWRKTEDWKALGRV